MNAVADPGFSRGGGGREPSRGGVNTPNFPENCMKSKEFGRPGGACVPHAPPLDPPMEWYHKMPRMTPYRKRSSRLRHKASLFASQTPMNEERIVEDYDI